MIFEELDQRFPNGFVDAHITSISVDYQKHTATLHLIMRGNAADSPDFDVYAPAVLTARKIYYVAIEPPDSAHLLGPEREKITVDGLSEDMNDPHFGQFKSKLPVGVFCCRFFVHDWNSFIHIGAAEAEFSWEAPPGTGEGT
jgi:hypothetical protein